MRLFNLAHDVPVAALSYDDGKALVDGVKYTLGSKWAAVAAGPHVFTAAADSAGTVSLARSDQRCNLSFSLFNRARSIYVNTEVNISPAWLADSW